MSVESLHRIESQPEITSDQHENIYLIIDAQIRSFQTQMVAPLPYQENPGATLLRDLITAHLEGFFGDTTKIDEMMQSNRTAYDMFYGYFLKDIASTLEIADFPGSNPDNQVKVARIACIGMKEWVELENERKINSFLVDYYNH